MNDIQTLNHKYQTVESLLTSSGSVSAAIIRRKWFKELNITKKIYKETSQLDIFGDVPVGDRISFLLNKMELEKCPICGKEHILFPHTNRRYRLCKHRFNGKTEIYSESKKKTWKRKMDNFISSLNIRELFLSNSEFENLVNEYFNKPENFNFSLTDKSKDFFHDVIIKTEKILPLDIPHLELSNRIYILKNNLKEIPKCMYCDKETAFRNRKIGYSKTCSNHFQIYGKDKRIENNINSLSSSIDSEKYEIVKLPKVMTRDELTIRCKKCGKESSWKVKNGMLGHLGKKFLCRYCEVNMSRAEEDIFEFVKEIHKGEIVHKNGSRKIIPPYELDIYIPEKKLAIEYDGIFWHGESHKNDKNYHLAKTETCEKNGIQLIHIFENEWLEKEDIVRSRLKDLLGIHDKTVYARKCNVVEIDPKTSFSFLEENHLQGGCHSSIRLGLEFEGELVSIMTFSKPRFRKNGPEWELVRFCNKIGLHVPGGASRLMKSFERKMHPKSILSYADRRWSVGKLYQVLGFFLVSKSKPNYWYFHLKSNWSKLINRISCQKHKLKDFLENFDPMKSEHENMKDNGYDRIFDCGNLVFVKEYN